MACGKMTPEAMDQVCIDTEAMAPVQMTFETAAEHMAAAGDAEGKPPPGCCCKVFCPPCAVCRHQGCGGACLCALCLGPVFTVCCWKPKGAVDAPNAGKEAGGKPAKGKKAAAGNAAPVEKTPTPASDFRIKMLGEDRRGCYDGATLDLKSCHYGQIDNVVIPFCQIYNSFVESFNGVVCFGERVKLLHSGYRFEIVLEDNTERATKDAGWKDETADFFGRVVAKGTAINHYASARGEIQDAAGKALSEDQLKALSEKMPDLVAQLKRLEDCQALFAKHMAKKDNKPDFKYGAMSLARQTPGGLPLLHVLRLPCQIAGDAKPPMFPDLMALKYLSGGYPREPDEELKTAVAEFNKATFIIRESLNAGSGTTMKSIIVDAVAGITASKVSLALVVTVNGKEYDTSKLKQYLPSAAQASVGDAKDLVEVDASKGKVSLKDLKMPKVPTIEDMTGGVDKFIKELKEGDFDLQLKPDLDVILTNADLPPQAKLTMEALLGKSPESLLSQLKEAFKFFTTLMDDGSEDVPPGTLSFDQVQVTTPEWYKDYKQVGKGSAVKYSQSLPKLFETLPDLAEEMKTFLEALVADPVKAIKPMGQGGNLPDKGVLGATTLPNRMMEYMTAVGTSPKVAMKALMAIIQTLLDVVEAFVEGAKKAILKTKDEAIAAVKGLNLDTVKDAVKEQAGAIKDGFAAGAQDQVDGAKEDLAAKAQEQADGVQAQALAEANKI